MAIRLTDVIVSSYQVGGSAGSLPAVQRPSILLLPAVQKGR